ncbi:MAG: glycerate kinase [Micrococcus sp.]|nr:glycerate kinase [Micrococcus sp.]
MTNVLLALDKFKGSLTATEACAVLADALRTAGGGTLSVTEHPIADGGEGTVAAALAAGFTAHEVVVPDALGQRHRNQIARRDESAVIELAAACGLPGIGHPTPQTHAHASTAGLGHAIAAALNDGARELLIGIGGSASTDAGLGLLHALGAEIVDDAGHPVTPAAGQLSRVAGIDLRPARQRLGDAVLTVACDVTAPLTGPEGAAHVFAVQKGASPDTLNDLDARLAHVAALLPGGSRLAATPGAGAAGGTGFALLALGARLKSGAEQVLALTGFADQAAAADIVIVGEGSLDAQTLQGKGPAVIAAAAHAAGVERVWAVAGRISLGESDLATAGISQAWSLRDRARSDADSSDRAAVLLRELGRDLAAEIAAQEVP